MQSIVQWASPLEDALLRKLNQPDLSMEDLEKLRGDIALLEGTDVFDSLQKTFEKKTRELDSRYDEALKTIQKAKSVSDAEKGIQMLSSLGNFRDAKEELEKAEKRRARLKRRPVIIILSAVALFTLFIIGSTMHNNALIRRIDDEIIRLQAIAEEGRITEAEEGLAAVLDSPVLINEHYTKLRPVTEAILEHAAREEGFSAAFERYESLKEKAPDALDENAFFTYSAGQLESPDISPVEKWDLINLLSAQKDAKSALNFSEEQTASLLNECLDTLSEELEQGSGRDMKAWADAQYSFMDRYRADPDSALRFLYALHGAGYDIAALFPKGILLDFPMAERVRGLLDVLLNEEEEKAPEVTMLLPLSVHESESYNGKDIFRLSSTSRSGYADIFGSFMGGASSGSSELDKKVLEMQKDDSHYEVRLLTEYLFSIPEDMLPKSFSECTSLLCMETVYLHNGSISKVTTMTTGSTVTSESTTYNPYFSAIDMIAVHDAKSNELSSLVNIQVHDAQAGDDEWFQANKSDSSLISRKNMLGEFDEETLREEYEGILEYVELLFLFL